MCNMYKMTCASTEPRYRVFVKGYGFFSFAENMSNNIVKNVSDKHSPGMLAVRKKLLDHAKKSAADVLKTVSKGTIQRTAEATGDFVGNKITYKITKNLP